MDFKIKGLDSLAKNLERSIKEQVAKNLSVEIKCPNCQNVFSAKAHENTCPKCQSKIQLNVKY